jgi:hypothetical protein
MNENARSFTALTSIILSKYFSFEIRKDFEKKDENLRIQESTYLKTQLLI